MNLKRAKLTAHVICATNLFSSKPKKAPSFVRKKKKKNTELLKEQITKAKTSPRAYIILWGLPLLATEKKALQTTTVNLVTRGSLLSGVQNSTPITQTSLFACYLLGRTSSAQKPSFANTEKAAALAFWGYLYCPLVLQRSWSKKKHSDFHISLPFSHPPQDLPGS